MFKSITSIEALWDILRSIRVQDILDILIVAYLVYKLINLLRETRAGQLIKARYRYCFGVCTGAGHFSFVQLVPLYAI